MNLTRRALGRPQLPRAGDCVDLSYAIVPAGTGGESLVAMLSALARDCPTRLLSIGLDSRDPRLSMLRARFRPVEHRTRIFDVRWPGGRHAPLPDGRLMYPEIATL